MQAKGGVPGGYRGGRFQKEKRKLGIEAGRLLKKDHLWGAPELRNKKEKRDEKKCEGKADGKVSPETLKKGKDRGNECEIGEEMRAESLRGDDLGPPTDGSQEWMMHGHRREEDRYESRGKNELVKPISQGGAKENREKKDDRHLIFVE